MKKINENASILTLKRRFISYGLRIIKSKQYRYRYQIQTYYCKKTVKTNSTIKQLRNLANKEKWLEYWRRENAFFLVELCEDKPEVMIEQRRILERDVARMRLSDFPFVVSTMRSLGLKEKHKYKEGDEFSPHVVFSDITIIDLDKIDNYIIYICQGYHMDGTPYETHFTLEELENNYLLKGLLKEESYTRLEKWYNLHVINKYKKGDEFSPKLNYSDTTVVDLYEMDGDLIYICQSFNKNGDSVEEHLTEEELDEDYELKQT